MKKIERFRYRGGWVFVEDECEGFATGFTVGTDRKCGNGPFRNSSRAVKRWRMNAKKPVDYCSRCDNAGELHEYRGAGTVQMLCGDCMARQARFDCPAGPHVLAEEEREMEKTHARS